MPSEVEKNKVLLLQEPALHPNSVLVQLRDKFEKPSILHIVRKEGLRGYTKPPVYDENFLVIFEDCKTFEANLESLNLEFMFPVVLCPSKAALDDGREICRVKQIPYGVYQNKFKKEDAAALIRSLTKQKVTKDFCDTLISRVGLSPQRIISAVMVCEQVGFTTSNLSKYVDKYVYIDLYDVIESLLGICSSRAQQMRAAVYLHMNRPWYKNYTQGRLVSELDTLIQIYRDLIDGSLTPYTMQEYQDSNRIPRYRVMYAIHLYETICITKLLALRQFLSSASILEVALHLE